MGITSACRWKGSCPEMTVLQYVTEDFTGYNVLVTGASGVLGSGVAQALRDAGANVTVLQRSASGLDGIREIRGSVTDSEAVSKAVEGVDSVIHIAAKVSVSGPLEQYQHVNVEGTRNVLSVAHAGHSIIGAGAEPADPQAARGHYAATKATGELLALAADSSAFRVLVLRPHLMWGPGDTQLTERIIDRARQNRLPLLDGGT